MNNQVHTFMDIKLVGKIIDYLFKIIGKSKVAVVVYSEKFASSDWCLKELDMILQLMKDGKMMMLPIFYKVKIHELKHLTGNTGKYLDEHVPKHGETNVLKWKTAVTTLGTISGLSYGDNSYEHDFITGIIKTVKDMLKEWKEPVEIPPKPHYSGMEPPNKTELDFIRGRFEEISIRLNRLDDKKELTRNQQTRVSAKEENTQALAVQTNVPQEVRGSSTGDQEEVYHIVSSVHYFQKLETMKWGKLIVIEPCCLVFYVDPEKPSFSWLTLGNRTDKHVAFMLKMDTEKQLNYSIYPNKGVLLPRSKCQVQVTMEAQTVLPSHEIEESKDTFLIQSVEAKKDASSTNDFSKLFTGMLSRFSIYKNVISVLYVAPPRGDSTVPKPLGQLLANKGLLGNCMLHTCTELRYIDTHPTKPWLLLTFLSALVSIWNYETGAEEKLFRTNDLGGAARCAKFIHEKHWIVVGVFGSVRVYNYNTSEKVKGFKAHEYSVNCIKVHPTSPYVLTASCDNLIKLWNWENDWACIETFEGHSSHVMDVAFNPKDSTSFASASRDGTIKIWSFGSSVAKFTINAQANRLNCVDYFVGNDNKLYLLSTSCDLTTVRVWDYASKTLVQTLRGHLNTVSTILVHPKLPIIITGSKDKTIRIWNKDTHQLKLVWTSDLGDVWSIGFIQASNEVVLGCKEGMAVIKIVDAVGTRSN